MAWAKVARFARRLPAARWSVILIGLAAYLAPAEAAAKSVTLSYMAYLAGYPVLSLNAQVDLPVVARDGRIHTGNGPYALNAAIVTEGSLASLYPYRMQVIAHGKVAASAVRPGQFHSEGQIMGKTEGITLTYGSEGHVDIQAMPQTRQAQDATANGTANGTIDPATLVMALVASFAEKQSCAGTYKLFDGVRRYDLNVQQVGTGQVQFYKQSFYQGPATECRATPQLIQGFAPMAVQSQLYPQSAELWLAAAVQGFPAVPVRIQTRNGLGSMTFDLVGVQ